MTRSNAALHTMHPWRWGCPRPSVPVLDEIPPDRGCEVAPKCLECPLPQCKYDDPAGYLRQQRHQRDTRMFEEMKQRGLTFVEVAKLYGVAERTVYRISRRHARC